MEQIEDSEKELEYLKLNKQKMREEKRIQSNGMALRQTRQKLIIEGQNNNQYQNPNIMEANTLPYPYLNQFLQHNGANNHSNSRYLYDFNQPELNKTQSDFTNNTQQINRGYSYQSPNYQNNQYTHHPILEGDEFEEEEEDQSNEYTIPFDTKQFPSMFNGKHQQYLELNKTIQFPSFSPKRQYSNEKGFSQLNNIQNYQPNQDFSQKKQQFINCQDNRNDIKYLNPNHHNSIHNNNLSTKYFTEVQFEQRQNITPQKNIPVLNNLASIQVGIQQSQWNSTNKQLQTEERKRYDNLENRSPFQAAQNSYDKQLGNQVTIQKRQEQAQYQYNKYGLSPQQLQFTNYKETNYNQHFLKKGVHLDLNQETTIDSYQANHFSKSPNIFNDPNKKKNSFVQIKDFEFSLKDMIGEGSFSRVYLGRKKSNPSLNVAVKIIDLAKQGSKFKDEIQICMKVNGNQNILKIYDHFIDISSNKCYLFLEYCKDGSLQSALPKLTRRQAIIYFRQILSGMKELYKHNIFHRDIKLDNILLSGTEIKISDFGLSKQVMNNQLEVSSIKCGTPSTMAPEIFFSQHNYPVYSNKCDIWSLGVIFHEMFYKSHPFDMNKEKLRKFMRVNVFHKCPIAEDFLSKSLVQSAKNRISLENICFHEINVAPLSRFNLLENADFIDKNKQISSINVPHNQKKQENNLQLQSFSSHHVENRFAGWKGVDQSQSNIENSESALQQSDCLNQQTFSSFFSQLYDHLNRISSIGGVNQTNRGVYLLIIIFFISVLFISSLFSVSFL